MHMEALVTAWPCSSPHGCRFEDGTVSFLGVIALKHGFDALERLTGQWTSFVLFLPYQGLVAARGVFSMLTLSWGMQDLIPRPGIEPGPPALGAWSLSRWTTEKSPWCTSLPVWRLLLLPVSLKGALARMGSRWGESLCEWRAPTAPHWCRRSWFWTTSRNDFVARVRDWTFLALFFFFLGGLKECFKNRDFPNPEISNLIVAEEPSLVPALGMLTDPENLQSS